MTLQSISALIAAIVTFAIGGSVLLGDRQRLPYRRFAFLCFNLCLWHLTYLLRSRLDWAVLSFLSVCAALLIPISSLRFFRAFLASEKRRSTIPPRALSMLAVLFLLGIGYTYVFPTAAHAHQMWLGFTLALFVFAGLGGSLATIYAAWRRTLTRVEKTRHFYLLIGGIAAIVTTALGMLAAVLLGVDSRTHSALSTIGNVTVIVYMYFLSQTLVRYRLLDLNELLGKMVVLSLLALILAAIYLLLVAWLEPHNTGLFTFNTIVASLCILILYEPLRTRIEGEVFRWMFRERYELRHRIEDLRLRLANVIDVPGAVRLVIGALEESHRVTHAALYLADQEGGGWELQGHLGPRPVDRVDAAARRPFVERLTAIKGGAPVSLEQLEREHGGRNLDDAERETLDAIARSLDELHAGVCVPVMAQEQLLGLLCLKDERLREAYATDEINQFRALAAQLAITLQNSKLYERMKERDRLAALGEMAAGLAHEIRNPLGSIKGAAQLLVTASGSGSESTVAESREFVGIIVEEVNRLNNVVSQFLDYARPYRGAEEPLDVNDVVRKTAQLLTLDPGIELVLVLDEGLPRVKGDAEQLRQVFLNLAINAMQAMPDGGKLTVSSAPRRSGKRAGTARGDASVTKVGTGAELIEVRFRDTGAGIPPGEVKNLFIPFFTTKEKGTGLGLPISQRIIENHGGRIEVRSRLGVGSTFTVVLPVLPAPASEREETRSSG